MARVIVSACVTEQSVRNTWAGFGVLAPLGAVAMVLLVVAAWDGVGDGWLCVVVAAAGFGVLAVFRGRHPSGLLSAALLGVATWYAGPRPCSPWVRC